MSNSEKLERQMNLLAALCDTRRPLRRAELVATVPGYASEPESARRMFERDKADLLELGVPLETIAGDTAEETGYRVDRERYELPSIDLEPEELAALHLALETIQVGVTDGEISRALWRLGGVIEPDGRTHVSESVVGEMREIPTTPNLVPLFRAATERRVVSFEYDTAAGESATRTIEPWHLGFERGRWYVRGHDRDRGERRNFRLDRIRGDVRSEGPDTATVARESGRPTTADPWEYGEGDAVVAEVRFDPVAAPIAAATFTAEPVRTMEDGSAVWSVPVTHWPAFRSFVLSFLDRAEILGPPDLRARMIEWLEPIADGGR